ncbi:MAG TPA: RnfABCDGE type electron transport complex subunit D [Elusimicrobiales bacterium]|nr:RnfABCDGE type electron transport complex subunit D [Elusimicrobiales bacterium]
MTSEKVSKINLIVSYPPYTRSPDNINKIMHTVVLALLPAIIASVYFFGWRALYLVLLSSASCIFFEGMINAIRKKPVTCFDGSALITGILLAFNLPSNLPYWMVIAGAFFAIVITKELFGGLGYNVFNPALAARVFLLISFPTEMTSWPVPFSADMVTAATPLGLLATQGAGAVEGIGIWQAFVGNIGGCIGETSGLALIIGAILLLARKCITLAIPASFILTAFTFTGIFHIINPAKYSSPDFHVVTGGLILGAFFMATDMVTSPLSKKNQVIFGMGCGLLTGIIRLFGGYPEGVSFAILIMNAFVPLLDKWDLNGRHRRTEEAK